MDLPLRKVAETSNTITFAWTPIPCVGYVFYQANMRVSNSWNTQQRQVQFFKGTGPYKVVALEAKATGLYPPAPALESEKYGAEQYSSGGYSK